MITFHTCMNLMVQSEYTNQSPLHIHGGFFIIHRLVIYQHFPILIPCWQLLALLHIYSWLLGQNKERKWVSREGSFRIFVWVSAASRCHPSLFTSYSSATIYNWMSWKRGIVGNDGKTYLLMIFIRHMAQYIQICMISRRIYVKEIFYLWYSNALLSLRLVPEPILIHWEGCPQEKNSVKFKTKYKHLGSKNGIWTFILTA